MKQVALFFANGTEECEALLVVDLLRRAGANVKIVSITNDLMVTSSHDVIIKADCFLKDVNFAEIDMLVLPGGMPGTSNLANCEELLNGIKICEKNGKKLAAICAAPSVFATLGLLQNKNATAHAAFKDKLCNAIVHDAEVVVDGNITTSYGLGGAIPFALELVRQLYDLNTAENIAKAIAYKHKINYANNN